MFLRKRSYTHLKSKYGVLLLVIGPIFFDETINATRYQEILAQFLSLLEENERFAWFQQDGAKAHSAANIISFLEEFFEGRIISTGHWPPRSPDLILHLQIIFCEVF